jgi:hypothetical protein
MYEYSYRRTSAREKRSWFRKHNGRLCRCVWIENVELKTSNYLMRRLGFFLHKIKQEEALRKAPHSAGVRLRVSWFWARQIDAQP